MKNYFLFIWFLSIYAGYAQEHDHGDEITIEGKIFTLENGDTNSVPGAKIYWALDHHIVLSDKNGNFKIHVKELPDTLFVKMTGYQLVAFNLTHYDKPLSINLSAGVLLNGVEIVAYNLGKTINLFDPRHIETIGEDELRKAACCNLSESFETNASVDVNLTDAVSGAKKIQMLGLDGIYTQFQFENIPTIRGLTTSFGLNYIPGTWIESIQITKGTGSVINGYESMAGLINLEFKKPTHSEMFYFNFYANRFSRLEFNIHSARKINDKWSTMTFAHYSNFIQESDVNSDGFRDFPIGHVGAFLHRWDYQGLNYETKFGIRANFNNQIGGQIGFKPSDVSSNLYRGTFKNEHLELFAKNGFLLTQRLYGSIGLIGQLEYHHMNTVLGNNHFDGVEKKFYFNSIYSDIIRNTNHKFNTGISFMVDDFVQSFNDSTFLKTEIVPGIFYEYTYNRLDKFIAVVGGRYDYHNLFGNLISPRLHIKWNINPKNALRLSTGRGYRVPNPFADNTSNMASSRQWVVSPNIQPEDAISSGITFTQKFMIRDEVSTFSIDYFYTHFLNQLIIDMDVAPNQLYMYSSTSGGYSHSFQAELSVKPIKNLELRAAYKFYDVKSYYQNQLNTVAFVPKFRALFNVGYTTRNKKWSFDATGNWIGKKRLPHLHGNPIEYQRPEISERYWIVNSQITYRYKKLSFYIGGENLLNVIQNNAIIAADDPYGSFFDATQLWAPITGFNIYIGMHLSIKQKSE